MSYNPHEARLTIWTLYEGPLDAPLSWVIRGHDVWHDGTTHAQSDAYFAASRAEVTEKFEDEHPRLYWLGRTPEDEPQIIGSWV